MRRIVLLLLLLAATLGPTAVAAAQQTELDWVSVEGPLPTGWSMAVEEAEVGPYAGNVGLVAQLQSDVGGTSWVNVYRLPTQAHTDAESFFASLRGESPYEPQTSTAELDGVEFWLNAQPGGPAPFDTVDNTTRTYYANVGDESVVVQANVVTLDPSDFDFTSRVAEQDGVVAQLRFDLDAAPAAAVTPDAESWKTVVGGLAAAAAAAAGFAAAVAAARPPGRDLDPDATVGHVLQLSTDHATVGPEVSTPLEATVWKVTGSGRLEPAPAAQLALRTPGGIGAQPASGPNRLDTSLWQTGDVASGSTLLVTASDGGSTTQAAVQITGQGASRLVLSTVPESPGPMRPTGDDVVRVVATLELGSAATADPSIDPEATRAGIVITSTGDAGWADTGRLVDVADGKALDVALSPPDPDSPGEPPESIAVVATATVGTEQLRERVSLAVERPPVVDCRPDRVEFAAGSGATEEIVVWVAPGGGRDWTFDALWREGEADDLATFGVRQDSPSSAVVTLTEAAGPDAALDRPTVATTLVLTVDHPDWARLERHVQVLVSAEGLYVDAIGRNPTDGTHHVVADGKGRPTEVLARVQVRDETGQIAFDPELSRLVRFEPVDDDSPGPAAWRNGGVAHSPGDVTGGNLPQARHTFTCPRVLPTAGGALPVRLEATVPGRDEPGFTARVPMSLVGVDTSPFSPAWQTELERCRYVVDTYVPREHRDRLHTVLTQRARTFGAEGLYEFRHQLWGFAETQVTREAHDHLDAAWWYQQVEDTLDWVSWCGDIAMGVASGQLVGTAAAVGVGLLKPVLVSAVTAWVEGQSIEQWAWSQVEIFAMVVEGAATDVDLLAKLSGGNRAKAWAIYISYRFVRELSRGQSVTEAMKNVCRDVRDQALVTFLRRFAGTSPAGAHRGDTDGPTKQATGADADTPVSKRPPPPDPRTVKKVIGRTKYRNGKPYADPADVLEIMRDPEATRSLKGPDADPVARDAFENTRQELYGHHDADLKQWVERNVADVDGREVRVAEVRTPGAEPSFNTDRDYRVLVKGTDPITGAEVWTEVPRERWADASHEIFAEHTGGPRGDAAAAQTWAESHQQLATDRLHAEACPDMADQVFVPDPDGSGRMVSTQRESNLARVKRGESILQSPEALGRVYRHKVSEQVHAGHRGEAYAQAAKSVRDTRAIHGGYRKQGYQVRRPNAQMRQAMDLVERAGTQGFDDPRVIAETDAKLRDLHIDGVEDFMNKLTSQLETLDWSTP